MKKNIIFLILWLPAISAVIYGIWYYQHQKFQPSTSKPIAKLITQKGEVQFRNMGDILWSETENNQYLFENDYISTLDSSKAIVRLFETGLIEIGPNTQIRIKSLYGDNSPFEINLILGNLKLLSQSQRKFKEKHMVIKSGKRQYNIIGKKAKINIAKDNITDEPDILEADGKIQVIKLKYQKGKKWDDAVDSTIIDTSESPFFLPKITKSQEPKKTVKKAISSYKKPQPPKVEVVKLEEPRQAQTEKLDPVAIAPSYLDTDYMPQIVWPPKNAVIWTMKRSIDLRAAKVPIFIRAPENLDEIEDQWLPLLGIVNPGILKKLGGVSKTFYGTPTKKDGSLQIIHVDIAQLLAENLTKISQSEFGQYYFEVKLGRRIIPKESKLPIDSFDVPMSVRIQSLSELDNRPIRLYLNRFAYLEPKNNWILSKTKTHYSSWINLYNPTDLHKLIGFLPASGGFNLESTTIKKGYGIFIVKDKKVIGSIQGKPSQKAIDLIRIKLNAHYIYKGDFDAFIGGKQQYDNLAGQKKLPKKIFILIGHRSIGINTNLIKTDKSIQKFINSLNSAYFVKPIEKISPPDIAH